MRDLTRKLCCLVLALTLLCGCAAASSDGTGAAEEEVSDSYDELIFPLIVSGELPENLYEVEQRLNEYIAPRIGAVIRFETVEQSTLEEFYLQQEADDQKTDFICLLPAESELFFMVDAGLLLPLDDLLEQYGEHILTAAEEVLEVGQMDAAQYLIPQVKDTYGRL